jgi:hypothetical protein
MKKQRTAAGYEAVKQLAAQEVPAMAPSSSIARKGSRPQKQFAGNVFKGVRDSQEQHKMRSLQLQQSSQQGKELKEKADQKQHISKCANPVPASSDLKTLLEQVWPGVDCSTIRNGIPPFRPGIDLSRYIFPHPDFLPQIRDVTTSLGLKAVFKLLAKSLTTLGFHECKIDRVKSSAPGGQGTSGEQTYSQVLTIKPGPGSQYPEHSGFIYRIPDAGVRNLVLPPIRGLQPGSSEQEIFTLQVCSIKKFELSCNAALVGLALHAAWVYTTDAQKAELSRSFTSVMNKYSPRLPPATMQLPAGAAPANTESEVRRGLMTSMGL